MKNPHERSVLPMGGQDRVDSAGRGGDDDLAPRAALRDALFRRDRHLIEQERLLLSTLRLTWRWCAVGDMLSSCCLSDRSTGGAWAVWTWRNTVAERLDPQGSVQPLLRDSNNRPPRSEEDPDEDDDEAPETPLDEPAPTSVQDPPAEPDPHPYTVNL
jgi:hypothetical protein